MVVLPHQDGYVRRLDALAEQVRDTTVYVLRHLVLVLVAVLVNAYLYASVMAFLACVLADVGIKVADTEAFLREAVEHFGRLGEECVVEAYDVTQAAVVGLELQALGTERAQFVGYASQYLPVAATPPVDALLDVAHEQAVAPRRLVFEEQDAEVVPLLPACVLEFVYHHVVELRACFLEDERSVAALDELAQQGWRTAQYELVVFRVDGIYFLLDMAEEAERFEVLEAEHCREHGAHLRLVDSDGFVDGFGQLLRCFGVVVGRGIFLLEYRPGIACRILDGGGRRREVALASHVVYELVIAVDVLYHVGLDISLRQAVLHLGGSLVKVEGASVYYLPHPRIERLVRLLVGYHLLVRPVSLLVLLGEDASGKFLDGRGYVPLLVVFHPVLHVRQQPRLQLPVFVHVLYHPVNSP